MLQNRSKILIVGNDPRWRDSVEDILRRASTDAEIVVRAITEFADVNESIDAAVVSIDGERTDLAVSAVASLVGRFPRARVVLTGCKARRDRIRAGFRAGAWSCVNDAIDVQEVIRALEEPERSDSPLRATDRSGAPEHAADEIRRPGEHSAFLHRFAAIRSACQQDGGRVTLGLFDLDGFHAFNERHPPAIGDSVLRWFEQALERSCGPYGRVFRDHDDEYVVIFRDADEALAEGAARRCRKEMRATPFVLDGRIQDVTVSVGIVESSAGCIETGHQLLRRARIAVSQAKHSGGDTTVTWSSLLDAPLSRVRREPLDASEVAMWISRMREQVQSTRLESTQALVAAIDARDPYTRMHSLSVSVYADWIGRRLKLPVSMLNTLRGASLLHDVGKIGVPDAILTKPGPLTDDEFEIVRRHPQIALDILADVSFLDGERPLILHHHERFDGGGYPTGLVGDAIPIGARILAVADALDTMFTPRTYKEAYGADRVREELVAARGRQFDPIVTDAALNILTEQPELFPDSSVTIPS